VFREDFSIRRSDEINKLQKDILNAINALAKEEGYDLVVGEGVVYANSRVDITDKILARLQGE
jgi:outer membrane protein